MSARSNRAISAIVLFILGVFTCLFMLSLGRAQSVVFSDSGEAQSTLAAQLNAATGTICVAIYSFTDSRLAGALVHAHARGVDVRVIADKSQSTGKSSQVIYLQQTLGSDRVQVRAGRVVSGIMHHKFCVIDGRVVLTGSFNWTSRAEGYNWENFVVLTNVILARQFAAEFNTMQKGTP